MVMRLSLWRDGVNVDPTTPALAAAVESAERRLMPNIRTDRAGQFFCSAEGPTVADSRPVGTWTYCGPYCRTWWRADYVPGETCEAGCGRPATVSTDIGGGVALWCAECHAAGR